MPGHQPVELNCQEVQVADLVQFGEIEICWSGGGDLLADRVDPALLIGLCRTLGDQEGALPIVTAVDHHE